MGRMRVSILSIGVAVLVLILKFMAYTLTSSSALKSDALESLVNIVSACFTLGAIIFAERPADESHPYGHGKIEYFSAAFEGGLISLASVLILYEAGLSFLEGVQVKQLSDGILLNLAAGLLNGFWGFFLYRYGKKHRSKAIEADGHHVLSDFYTSLGLLVALILVQLTHWYWLDPIIAAAMGLLLAYTGFKLVRESSEALLDKEDLDLVEKIIASMNAAGQKDIISVHALRTLRSGRHTHIDVHVAIPEFYPLNQAHDLVDEFSKKVLQKANIEGEFHAHLDPCRQMYCKNCLVEECPIRKEAFDEQIPIQLNEAVLRYPKIRS